MLSNLPRGGFVSWARLSVLLLAGCTPSGAPGPTGSQSREADLNGLKCELKIQSEKDPELTWAVTDRVVAGFDGHQLEIAKTQVTLDNQQKKLPAGTTSVTINVVDHDVTIQADGKALFAPPAR
ncbi:hypothetical protein SAMN05444166_4093 [Singulisphaera sp. GP187]|uniref:hypothetical protein n=1 Tax=Singulisphaera sp. GP187 TaxID=1882752 RepID=UPI00092A8484|nr:hypothetical protein [Singulisphaera sp. GP187]SIO36124.1 hypothetical protein SAMN05444166_4093 [Singulisphaera sp. GP187]